MAKINEFFVAISLISVVIILLPNQILCKPTGRNSELIDGNDFLSLFLDQNHPMSSKNHDESHYKDQSKSANQYEINESNNSNNNNNKVELTDEIYDNMRTINNDDELLTQDTSNYGQRLNERMRNQKYIPKHKSSTTTTTTTSPTTTTATTATATTANNLNKFNYNHSRNIDTITSTTSATNSIQNKQIVKMVTTGSKIVFLEEMTPTILENPSTITFSPLPSPPPIRSLSSSKTIPKSKSDDIQVIAISVSSTVGRSRKNKHFNNNNEPKSLLSVQPLPQIVSTTTTTTQPSISMPLNIDSSLFVDENMKMNINRKRNNGGNFINHSHKSEFSIEESEPVTQIDAAVVIDSVNGESTNIHSILAPPNTNSGTGTNSMVINQSQTPFRGNIRGSSSRSSSSSRTSSSSSSSSSSNNNSGSDSDITMNRVVPTVSNIHIGNNNEHEQQSIAINRMQRKQDKLVPFQTVIYHDTGYNKDGTTQPRSVSYSSIGQSIDELNAWKDLEGLLEAKQNVNESLRQLIDDTTTTTYTTTSSSSTNQNHETSKLLMKIYDQQPEKIYSEPAKFYSEPSKVYGEPSKYYSEPSKIYSEPAKMYGQVEKQYGEPSKIYSEPAKIYGEPSKVYSEPAKSYGEPSKVYWPRPTHLPLTTTTATATTTTTNAPPPPTTTTIKTPPIIGTMKTTEIPPFTLLPSLSNNNQNFNYKIRNPSITNSRRVIFNLDKLPYDLLNAPESSKRLLALDTSNNNNNGGSSSDGNGDVVAGRRLRPSVNTKSKSQIIDNSETVHTLAASDDENNPKNTRNNDQDNINNEQQQQHYNQHQYQNTNHHYNIQNTNNNYQHHHHHHQHQYHHEKPQNEDDQLINSEIDNKNNMETNFGEHNNFNSMRIREHHRHQPLITDQYMYRHQHHSQPTDLVTKRPNYSLSSISDDSSSSSISADDNYTPTPEQNYEIEESVSVMTNGRAHGIEPSLPTRTSSLLSSNTGITHPTTSAGTNPENSDDSKTGYVVEGRNFRKYRVEEKTDDGFIVGEYGVVSHNDGGGVRGVRYTADSNINPSLIHQALMKFLSL